MHKKEANNTAATIDMTRRALTHQREIAAALISHRLNVHHLASLAHFAHSFALDAEPKHF